MTSSTSNDKLNDSTYPIVVLDKLTNENFQDNQISVKNEQYPTLVIQSSVIRSTELVLQQCSPLDLQKRDLVIAMKADHSLKLNEHALSVLTKGIALNKYTNSTAELKDIQQKMQKNIVILQQRLEIYRKSIRQESEEIDCSIIKGYFTDPQTADVVIDKIKLCYQDILRDSTYGITIRSAMVALSKPQAREDATFLKKCIQQCIEDLVCVKGDIHIHVENGMPGLDELTAVQEALYNLMKIFSKVENVDELNAIKYFEN